MGARIVHPKQKYHAMRIVNDRRNGEIVLVGHGKTNMYLWVGPAEPGGDVYTFSGRVTLRKLAQQILEIVGEEP